MAKDAYAACGASWQAPTYCNKSVPWQKGDGSQIKSLYCQRALRLLLRGGHLISLNSLVISKAPCSTGLLAAQGCLEVSQPCWDTMAARCICNRP